MLYEGFFLCTRKTGPYHPISVNSVLRQKKALLPKMGWGRLNSKKKKENILNVFGIMNYSPLSSRREMRGHQHSLDFVNTHFTVSAWKTDTAQVLITSLSNFL